MGKVIIMRECPGSGKTTFLNKEYPTAFICSATAYFTNKNGQYKFYKDGLSQSHTYCMNAFMAALANNLPIIAVDNTHIKLWEFENYIDKAIEYSYEIEVLRMKVDDAEEAARRNIHGVPIGKVLWMHENMQGYPGEIIVSA